MNRKTMTHHSNNNTFRAITGKPTGKPTGQPTGRPIKEPNGNNTINTTTQHMTNIGGYIRGII